MDDQQLSILFANILRDNFPSHKGLSVSACFKKKATLNHSIERKGRHILLKISGAFRDIPQEIIKSLGMILFAKIFGYKAPADQRKIYNTYIKNHLSVKLKPGVRKPSGKYTANGKHLNLEQIFDDINREFFSGRIQKPILGWSLNDSYTRLGFYSSEKNLLVISRIFDRPKTPLQVVRFLMYHEMLHIVFPVQNKKGRRIIHSADFRKMERQFPGFADIQKWLKRKGYFI